MNATQTRPLAVITGASSGIGHELAKAGSSEKDDPAEVARQGFDALIKGKERVVAGSLANRLMAYGGRFVPDRAKAEAHRLMAEPRSSRN